MCDPLKSGAPTCDTKEAPAVSPVVDCDRKAMVRPVKAIDLDPSRIWAEVHRLAAPGVIGFHTHFEVTEVFAVFEKKGPAHNVLSLLVAEERAESDSETQRYIGNQINLRSFKGAMFGIKRSSIAIVSLENAIDRFKTEAEWRLGEQRLLTGTLAPIEPLFVPSDSTELAPLNNILKNNFWGGSHVLELMDTSKGSLRPLIDVPSRLQELSEAIQKHLPLRIAHLSDRLGNIVIQMPVTVLLAGFAKNRLTGPNDGDRQMASKRITPLFASLGRDAVRQYSDCACIGRSCAA